DEEEVAWVCGERLLPGASREDQVGRPLQDSAGWYEEKAAVLEKRGVQRDEWVVLEAGVAGQVLLDQRRQGSVGAGGQGVAQRGGEGTCRRSFAGRKALREVPVDKHQAPPEAGLMA